MQCTKHAFIKEDVRHMHPQAQDQLHLYGGFVVTAGMLSFNCAICVCHRAILNILSMRTNCASLISDAIHETMNDESEPLDRQAFTDHGPD